VCAELLQQTATTSETEHLGKFKLIKAAARNWKEQRKKLARAHTNDKKSLDSMYKNKTIFQPE